MLPSRLLRSVSIKSMFILRYTFVPDILEKRQPHRAKHLALAQQETLEGRLLVGGASDPPSHGFLVFQNVDKAHVERFAQADPYVSNRLVTEWTVTPLMAAAGTALTGGV
uniref:YCII-related domain-containing protein n=1 Tax=Chromera velia CCMP2878 TaxID=1169474 RepID=A0A0G4FEV5_9ALVE|eukprot:Cvel_3272.t1-p1 / transcript=Cvel_3272.t1 / gene=Cvel_3272 / organism=Chromera_velia_CCMP2878 / gene_product=hypothetical protein / transcript_product=hypothetical protein / location=Cvel_scaffold128:105499-107264(+) / protein_length=109 / sequence_SO=supercontig / SO=protein_coding / is_pseudo=false